jgi:hypothetical protein
MMVRYRRIKPIAGGYDHTEVGQGIGDDIERESNRRMRINGVTCFM